MMERATPPLIGFLGIGAMGLPMALRIHAGGHRVRAMDVSPDRVAEALGAGIEASARLDDLARADALFVVVATGDQLLGLLDSDVLSGAGDVKTVVVLSTVGIDVVRKFEEQLGPRGITVVDCPVTGGVPGAAAGTLSLFAAGEASAIQNLAGVLGAMGTVEDCGSEPGDGQAYKMVNQLLAASHLAIAGEALSFARGLGLDPERVLGAVTGGAGASWMLADRGPRMVLTPGQRPVRTHLSIFVKDTALVMAAAEEAGFDARILSTVAREFRRAADEGLESADDSSIVDINRNLAGN